MGGVYLACWIFKAQVLFHTCPYEEYIALMDCSFGCWSCFHVIFICVKLFFTIFFRLPMPDVRRSHSFTSMYWSHFNSASWLIKHFVKYIMFSFGPKIKYYVFPLPRPTRKNLPDPKYFIAKTEMIYCLLFWSLKIAMKMKKKTSF